MNVLVVLVLVIVHVVTMQNLSQLLFWHLCLDFDNIQLETHSFDGISGIPVPWMMEEELSEGS